MKTDANLIAKTDKLTDTYIRSFKPKGSDVKVSDGKGLYLLIKSNGGKYFRYSYRFAGKQQTLVLGVYPEVSLKQARDKRSTPNL